MMKTMPATTPPTTAWSTPKETNIAVGSEREIERNGNKRGIDGEREEERENKGKRQKDSEAIKGTQIK